tara:strand:+ start:3411 stop:3641 length:231 start_codon:yes stop_codon:yes gene_type:complete
MRITLETKLKSYNVYEEIIMDLKKEIRKIKGDTITRKSANALFNRYMRENVGGLGLKKTPIKQLFMGQLQKKFKIK